MRVPSFGLGREFYTQKPARVLKKYRLRCHTGDKNDTRQSSEAGERIC